MQHIEKLRVQFYRSTGHAKAVGICDEHLHMLYKQFETQGFTAERLTSYDEANKWTNISIWCRNLHNDNVLQ